MARIVLAMMILARTATLTVTVAAMTVLPPAVVLPSRMALRGIGVLLLRGGGAGRLAHPRNGLTDELFDGADRLGVDCA